MKTIQIGAQVWTIKTVKKIEADPRAAGLCDSDTNTIWIRKGPVDQMRDTLLHEVMHAILTVAGVDIGKKKEEQVIKTLAPWLDMILDWKVRE